MSVAINAGIHSDVSSPSISNHTTVFVFFSKTSIVFIMATLLVLTLGSVSVLGYHPLPEMMIDANPRAPRGVREGVSSKELLTSGDPFGWSNNQLQWQRTAYHFQPVKNWMNGT